MEKVKTICHLMLSAMAIWKFWKFLDQLLKSDTCTWKQQKHVQKYCNSFSTSFAKFVCSTLDLLCDKLVKNANVDEM